LLLVRFVTCNKNISFINLEKVHIELQRYSDNIIYQYKKKHGKLSPKIEIPNYLDFHAKEIKLFMS
jgi:hypothetical protein